MNKKGKPSRERNGKIPSRNKLYRTEKQYNKPIKPNCYLQTISRIIKQPWPYDKRKP